MKNSIVKSIMLIGLITSNMTYSNTNITDTIKEHWPTARQATIDIANLYVRCFISTLGHELGHTIMYRLLYGESVGIVLGTDINNGSNFPLSIGGFNPLIGKLTDFAWPKDSPIRNLFCIAAGPIAGVITTYIVNKLADSSPYAIKTPFLKHFRNLYYGIECIRIIPYRTNKLQSEGSMIITCLKKILK